MLIRIDDLSGPEIRALLEEHLQSMHELSPPESVHALDLTGLRKPRITFWTAWSHDELLGCGALKELDPAHGEIKSMRTSSTRRREGVGRAMLEHIVSEARSRLYASQVAQEADRLGRVVANMLEFTRLERGALTVRPEEGDLGGLTFVARFRRARGGRLFAGPRPRS